MSSEAEKKPIPPPERRMFPKGTSIFKEGDAADAAYIIESGAVSIFKVISGKRIPIGSVGPRGIFGELGVLDDGVRMAAAVTTDDTVCAVVTKEAMEQMLTSAPPGLLVLMRSMAQMLRQSGNDLADARFQLQENEREKDA